MTSSGRTTVRVIAGQSGDVDGPLTGIATEPLYLDVTVARQSRFEQDMPSTHTLFATSFRGRASSD